MISYYLLLESVIGCAYGVSGYLLFRYTGYRRGYRERWIWCEE